MASITQVVHQPSKKAPRILPRTTQLDDKSMDDIDERIVSQNKSTKMPVTKSKQNILQPKTSNNSNRYTKNKIQHNKSVENDDDNTSNDAAF